MQEQFLILFKAYPILYVLKKKNPTNNICTPLIFGHGLVKRGTLKLVQSENAACDRLFGQQQSRCNGLMNFRSASASRLEFCTNLCKAIRPTLAMTISGGQTSSSRFHYMYNTIDCPHRIRY
ncbi:hypothetical protein T07_13512 [Trichinella nelsoni]|uniref:Uncharacterized protein n=1 Tax=Trichinella nelsoni TaxID=6336 RepID=A0A0V0RWV1_9BILA|nr:hypothetical protein T07_13512 [Trichinella nelsoni]